MGTFKVEVFVDEMPYTSSSFVGLVKDKFYDGLTFHRVIDEFMLQFGCPYSKDPTSIQAGTGGPKPSSKFAGLHDGKIYKRMSDGSILDEHKAKLSNLPFTLSMANTGAKNSGGSQFFINTVHNEYLDYWTEGNSKHPVFGIVIEGKDVIHKIEKVECDRSDKPTSPVTVISAKVL
uniref:Peptidyl-prolyl cis-trans isomerase n=1 Tax=Lotharella globosa TaxID=91324 RepID=A0A7S4DH34_9EUKA